MNNPINLLRFGILAAVVVILLVPAVELRASEDDEDEPHDRVRQRIEDVRKMKLIDILDLRGEQVEKFFGSYNTLQRAVFDAKDAVNNASRTLHEALQDKVSDADVQAKTTALLSAMKAFDAAVEMRNTTVQSLLSTTQYAKYVLFEARFVDELSKMIMKRARRLRDR